MKIADDVEPGSSRFGDVERKVRRANVRRGLGSIVAVAAVIAALAVAVPQLGNDAPDLANEPTGEPTTSPAPVIDVETVFFRHEEHGYQLRMPADWRVSGFEGAIELIPPGQIGLAAGEDTFAVELMHLVVERHDEAPARFEPADDIGGREALRSETLAKDGTRQVFYRVDWTGAGCTKGAVCDAEISTLQILIHGSTQELWDRFAGDALSLVSTIETTYEAEFPTGLEVRTPRGDVDGEAVTYDELTITLVRWLEARVAGGDAEGFMTANANEQYAAREGEWGLYAYGDPALPWTMYEVTARAGVDANAVEFTVELWTTNQDNERITLRETIGVGAGGAGNEIRFSLVIGESRSTRAGP